jgi:hypothetical protein
MPLQPASTEITLPLSNQILVSTQRAANPAARHTSINSTENPGQDPADRAKLRRGSGFPVSHAIATVLIN